MNKLVVIIFFVIIVVVFSVKLYLYNKSFDKSNEPFPPFKSLCPDYWKVQGTGNNLKCINVKNLGNCNHGDNNSASFQDDKYKGKHGICAKSRWARLCGVTWNGVTNAGATLEKVCGQQ